MRGSSFVAAAFAVGCATRPPPPPQPAETVDVKVGALEGGWDEHATAEPTAVEPGFRYCCGNAVFKMEIDCSEMLKRCYQRRAGVWHQTYGRHCKEELGSACYLEACEARCE